MSTDVPKQAAPAAEMPTCPNPNCGKGPVLQLRRTWRNCNEWRCNSCGKQWNDLTVEDARGEGKLEGWVARIRAEQEQSARLANEFPDIWGNGENATWTVSTAPEPHRPLESGALERNNAARIPKRRVSAPSADFDRTAGQWMHEAHAKLERQSVKASRGRKTPNLPPEKYREIVEQTDKSKRNGEPRFPLKEVLSERVWKEIADYNTKAGTADKRLSQWRDVAFHRRFKRAVRHRYNRAEIHYRKYFVPQQS